MYYIDNIDIDKQNKTVEMTLREQEVFNDGNNISYGGYYKIEISFDNLKKIKEVLKNE